MKKRILTLSLSAASMLLSLVGCGEVSTGTSTSVDSSKTSITACIASEPSTIDPALNSAVDGATYDSHLFEGLYCYQDTNGDGKADLVPGLAAAAPAKVTNADKSVTYDFTLREGIKFSDGTSITADDFVYSWNRAASGALAADYAYMFDVVKNATAVEADTTGTEKLGISASADKKHFFVTLPADVPYFYELCAFPAMMAVKQAAVESSTTRGGWCTEAKFITSGAYTVDSWTHNSEIVLKKNPNYWNASKVTMGTITFALSDDTANMYTNYVSDDYQMIDDFDTSLIDTLKTTADYHIQGQLGTYYVIFNVDSTLFDAVANTEEKRQTVRRALGLFIDRDYLVENITKGGQQPANSFVPTGLTDADGVSEFTSKNGTAGDGTGYYKVGSDNFAANVAEGVQMLKDVGYTYDETSKKFTNFPTAGVYLYNTSSGHQKIAEYIQGAFKTKGIDINLQNQEWNTFLETRKGGNFDIARNGWLADYNDPITFLDMWTTGSGNNDAQFGKANDGKHDASTYTNYSIDLNNDGTIADTEKNLTWANSYDKAIAAIKASTDTTFRYAMMHKAETLLMSTGAICPLYFYTDMFLIKTSVKGFYTSPLGYKFFAYASN